MPAKRAFSGTYLRARAFRSTLAALAFAALPVAVRAAAPLPAETVAEVAATLQQCTGVRYEGSIPAAKIGGAELAPRADLLTQPSAGLSFEQGTQIYEVAKSFLGSPPEARKAMADPTSILQCPPRPGLGVQIFEYLAGEAPGDLRGPTNTLDWLGLAYELGLGGRDPIKARQFYLRGKLHGSYTPIPRWSDGRDDDPLANAARAGMQPYVDALASDPQRGAAVRMLLAEQALPSDPAKARRLLQNVHDRSLTRLLELEQAGRVPFVTDAADITLWARASQSLFGYVRYAGRLLEGVRRANGGTIPVSAARPAIASLRPHLDFARLAFAPSARAPIPVRALVDPQGQPIYVEACMAAVPAESVSFDDRRHLLGAARLYNAAQPERLPKLPLSRIAGKPAYGWVLLPPVHFKGEVDGKQQIDFGTASPEQCRHSAIVDMPPPPAPPPPPPPFRRTQ